MIIYIKVTLSDGETKDIDQVGDLLKEDIKKGSVKVKGKPGKITFERWGASFTVVFMDKEKDRAVAFEELVAPNKLPGFLEDLAKYDGDILERSDVIELDYGIASSDKTRKWVLVSSIAMLVLILVVSFSVWLA